jgi:GGDEF domain-containing protein
LALAAVGIGLLEAEPWWQGEVQGAIWPIFLSFSSAFLVSGLYGLTWRRAYLDELTGVPGRRAFEEAVRRLGRRYAIAMLDVDHFKRINDRYGHPVGDQVLRFIASRLQRLPFGQAYRYGGEEFALIMRGKRAEGALALMEDLRQSIEGSTLTLRGKDRPDRKPGRRDRPAGGRSALRFTVSIGLAQRDRTHATPQAVLKAADEALYRAKRAGRNRVEWERRKSRR